MLLCLKVRPLTCAALPLWEKAHCGGPPRRSGTPTLTWRELSHSCALGEVHLNTLKQKKKKFVSIPQQHMESLEPLFWWHIKSFVGAFEGKQKLFFFPFALLKRDQLPIYNVFIIKKNMLGNNNLKSAQTLSVVVFLYTFFFLCTLSNASLRLNCTAPQTSRPFFEAFMF